ncbi:efflux RND transporter periplasmic adaptor subunit [Flavobacterium sp. MR2016-29]|uniref:efflux RND transporter periplasmic adaptor subunit n=1 Tax=Flavobacterium sp. MR2016-29 TaxID=2783795 RepID=UPI00188D711A|nr:efflux RND transporter periplasmic adaptor subunit [Flavobacterium sp. MR2016-29]MBF4491554.1 efflux RND transporter periplasmic adaptor subunit [Flavobacterium sp. MR2016-29]
MKTLKMITLLSILLMVMIACNSKNKEDHSGHKMTDETTFYTCSMDPQIKEDKPGKCPICHMHLTPVKLDKTNSNEISLSKQQIRLGNISLQSITTSQSSVSQNYTGTLAINQDKINSVSSRAMGRIEKLFFKTVGDYVVKNQAVYQLYSEDIAIAKQDYFTALKQLSMPGDFGKNAKNMLASAKQKLLFYGLTNAQIENIKTNKDVSPNTIFYSSHSGTISEIVATEGSYVMEGSGIIKMADLNSLWLETQVNVNYAKSLKIGQKASVTFSDFPDKTINTQVAFINPEINSDTRLLLIRMEIPNQGLQLKPGMQAVVKLTQSNAKGLFIPIDAVIREENASYIWVEKRPGIFENVMVETGIETNGMIEIRSDLDSSKKVVITGAYAINSEYKFRKGSDPMEGMKM